MNLTLQTHESINCVNTADWNRLDHGQSPFLEHGFLCALEGSASLGESQGWIPRYLTIFASGDNWSNPTLVGAVATFIKLHSYGEYIFDWSWAQASERAGISYYPKILVAAPFTPSTGKRLLIHPDLDQKDRKQVISRLIDAVFELSEEEQASSIHWLFVDQQDRDTLCKFGFFPRSSFQFHWHNHHYENFSSFLGTMTSRRRKQIRKEQRFVQQHIDEISFVSGQDIDAKDVELITRFYKSTAEKHGAYAYLGQDFFPLLMRKLGHRVQFARAVAGGQTIAGALYLESQSTLFGRYWGSIQEMPYLHFELAYYAGIQRCIDRGMQHFEAGAQGEHKLLRGFIPTETHSAHWIRHPRLREVVMSAVQHESQRLTEQMGALAQYGPFHKEDS